MTNCHEFKNKKSCDYIYSILIQKYKTAPNLQHQFPAL